MKRILCFGDSLTHGTMPSDSSGKRYDDTKRWTGILQEKLTGRAVVIEEGLPSRTINKEDNRPNKEGRNGSVYLWPCVGSHVPLDLVIVWLGTNDTKDMFNEDAPQITEAFKQMLIKLRTQLSENSPTCKIIIMSPPQMNSESEGAKAWYSQAQPKLAQLPAFYKQLAEELQLEFIDLYPLLGVPQILDGIHLSEEQNRIVADKVYEKLSEIERGLL